MAKNDKTAQPRSPEAVISIIGVGMTLTGDCETDGALRIEGRVKGDIRAGKSVVIGKEGVVDGNIYTQDAVISGRVLGSVHAQSRLELQTTGLISGEIIARRMQLEEGASVQGQVAVGEAPPAPEPKVEAHAEGGQRPAGGPKPGQPTGSSVTAAQGGPTVGSSAPPAPGAGRLPNPQASPQRPA